MPTDRYTKRPFAYPTKVIKDKDGFKAVPFAHKSRVVIPRFVIPFPLQNGKFMYLDMPCNYSRYDVEIIIAQLKVVEMSLIEPNKETPKKVNRTN